MSKWNNLFQAFSRLQQTEFQRTLTHLASLQQKDFGQETLRCIACYLYDSKKDLR